MDNILEKPVERKKPMKPVVLATIQNINKLCRLRSCEHADITSDDVGRIVEIVDKYGYGIEFTKVFKVDANKNELQTNTIYGEAKYVELV
jgi:hypothetical protein